MRIFVQNNSDIARLEGLSSPAGQVTNTGTTTHFNVGVLPNVGPNGSAILAEVLSKCETNYQNLNHLFGFDGPSFNVTITALSQNIDGSGGAMHRTCSDSSIIVDACVSPIVKPLITCALIVAEMVEVYQAIQNGGWNCGASNGEGLSRVLASAEYPGVLDDYACAPAWLSSWRPDFVNVNDQTDRDDISNGCAVLFLNYLHSHLGFSWKDICQNPANNLAGTYKKLTGRSIDPFPEFSDLLKNMYPPHTQYTLNTDNPFIAHNFAANSLSTPI